MKGQAAGRGDAIALRRLLHEHLAPEAWPRPGLSPINKLVCGAIIVGSALTIVETEPAVHVVIPEPMFFAAELTFALLFLVEYIARVYAAGEDARYRGAVGRVRYMLTPLALLDLAAIAPFLLGYGTTDTFLLRVLRLLRIFRLARLGRFSVAIHLLAGAIRSR